MYFIVSSFKISGVLTDLFSKSQHKHSVKSDKVIRWVYKPNLIKNVVVLVPQTTVEDTKKTPEMEGSIRSHFFIHIFNISLK